MSMWPVWVCGVCYHVCASLLRACSACCARVAVTMCDSHLCDDLVTCHSWRLFPSFPSPSTPFTSSAGFNTPSTPSAASPSTSSASPSTSAAAPDDDIGIVMAALTGSWYPRHATCPISAVLPSVLIYEAPTRSRDLRSVSSCPSVAATCYGNLSLILAEILRRRSRKSNVALIPGPVLCAVFIEAAHNRNEQ